MPIWHEAADKAREAMDDLAHHGLEPTPDQKLALAQVWATLSVAQELSRMIMYEGLSVRLSQHKPSERKG